MPLKLSVAPRFVNVRAIGVRIQALVHTSTDPASLSPRHRYVSIIDNPHAVVFRQMAAHIWDNVSHADAERRRAS
jgi:hypothetical protein